MAEGRYPHYIIDQIRSSIPLSEVIERYTSVDRYNKALCPFHDDHHPSLSVNDPKSVWYCHACQKGGDIFSFVMQAEKISFRDAVKLLASKCGIKLLESGNITGSAAYRWQKIEDRVKELAYLEHLFKNLEKPIYDYFRFRLLSLRPKDEWTAKEYTREMIIMEDFDELDALTRKRKSLFMEMRRDVKSGKLL